MLGAGKGHRIAHGDGTIHLDVRGVHPAVDGGAAARHFDEVVGVLGVLCHGGDFSLAGLTGGPIGGVGADIVLGAGKGHRIAHRGLQRATRAGGAWGCSPGASARRGPRVVHIGELSVLGPGAGVAACLAADVPNSGDLHFILPLGGTFHSQAAPNIDADMAGHPDGLTNSHVGPAGGAHAGAFGNHGISADVGHTVDGVGRPAIGFGGVPVPAPEDALDEINAIKAINRRALIGGGLNHGRAVRGLIVGVVGAVAAHTSPGQRGPKAAHHIQGLVVLGDVNRLVNQFLCGHLTQCNLSFT